MKTNRALFISVLLNLALLTWIVALSLRQHELLSSNPAISNPASLAASKSAHNPPPQSAATNQSARFDWRQVESADYKEYIANLRAIGCPEKTIREIITADVNDLFASRRAAITQTNHYEYWRPNHLNLTAEQTKDLQDLLLQKNEVLKALGVESSDMADLVADLFRGEVEDKNLALDFLPEPKRQNVKDLLYRMAQQQIAAGENSAASQDLENQAQTAIKSLLTPEELHDYELRTSTPAQQLSSVLQDLKPTESEFKTIYDYWTALSANPPGSPEYRQAQQTSEAALQSLLGPDRFQLYLKGVKMLNYSQ